MKTYYIDGANFHNLDEFYEEISRQMIPDVKWGRNLDAFYDVLGGGFGLPNEDWRLVWKNAEISRERLGYPYTAKWYKERLERTRLAQDVEHFEAAQRQEGETIFDILVLTIKAWDHIHLELK